MTSLHVLEIGGANIMHDSNGILLKFSGSESILTKKWAGADSVADGRDS